MCDIAVMNVIAELGEWISIDELSDNNHNTNECKMQKVNALNTSKTTKWY